MSGKKLTRKELGVEKKFWRHEFSKHGACGPMWNLTGRLFDHIEAVGVFAPEEPTDDEINEAIAKAQGWNLPPYEREWVWEKNDGSRVRVADYQPVSNLGQALEAAAALQATVSADVDGSTIRVRCGRHFTKEQFVSNQQEAARIIAHYLHEQITDGDS